MTQEATKPPRIEVTRTELVWPGKYNSDGTLNEPPRVNLPFQVIERVNETRATREARKEPQELSLFDVWEGDEGETFDDGWRNKLIWGDNLLVMSSLLEKFAGKIDLIYIDPPFATGADFGFSTDIGDSGLSLTKAQSAIEEKAYRDTWGRGHESYLSMLYDRLRVMKQLLRENGTIFVHLDYRVNSYVRVILDEIFGVDSFRNEIVWCYSGGATPKRDWPRKHDTLLRWVGGDNWKFNVEYKPYKENTQAVGKHSTYAATGGKSIDIDLERGTPVTDWWTDIATVTGWNPEVTGYDTQKPEALLSRIINATTEPGDLVADFFCGSGTTMAAAERANRRWIGCDLGRWAIHVSRKRLLDIEDARPFEVLNLGQYERQYWQGVAFGDDRSTTEQTLYEYLAFILRLYGAEPVTGLAHLHGKKDKAMVHVGSVDAPVTIDEIMAAVRECSELKQTELHVLGWEWEMGLYDLMVDEAEKLGVKLIPFQIPREVMEEQAVDKGDVQFFELAHLEVFVNTDGREAVIELKDFVIPNTELIPDDIRDKVQKWSDYIDYWGLDWNFHDDTFMQGWVTYRTRKDRSLDLVSDTYTYDGPGRYTVVVKVIDIFGNDTSQAYLIEVD